MNVIEDIQARADSRSIAIDKVGIKDILHPVRVRDKSGGEQHTTARNLAEKMMPAKRIWLGV